MKVLAWILVATVAPALGQIVQTGPNDPNYCEKIEHVEPNLVLSRTTHLRGRIVDGSGAPFTNSLVELRLYQSESQQVSLKKVRTDEGGHFDLDSVSEGKYRLLASSTRLFKQAEKLECRDDDPCTLLITLKVSSSDQPDMFCPVK